jgi:hypothetical protein
VAVDKRLLNVASRVQRRGRGGGYGFAMATNQKPEVEVPSDQPPSYQLEIEDIVEGEGDEAVAGKIVEVHYVGVSWKNGKQFDASRTAATRSSSPSARARSGGFLRVCVLARRRQQPPDDARTCVRDH